MHSAVAAALRALRAAASAHALAACECTVKLEYFHDHVRIERMLFDGTLSPEDGVLRPDDSRPGLGLELKRADAEGYALSPASAPQHRVGF